MLNTQIKVLFFASLTLSTSLAYSYAPEQGQNDKRRGPPPFSQLDLNGDNSITLEEFSQHQVPRGDHEHIFNRIDSNGDQLITELELTSHKPPCPRKSRGDKQE